MEKLYEALTLIDTIDIRMSQEEIKAILKKAYELSDDCLDALTLLSRFYDDGYQKEMILAKGLSKEVDLTKDDIMVRQYIRLLYEACMNYIDIGHLPMALGLANKIYAAKGDIFNIKDVLYALNAYFDKDKDDEGVTLEVKALVDLLYAYERSNYEKADVSRSLLQKLVPGVIEIARGSEEKNEENDKAASLFMVHAYYINRIEGVIYYIGEKI